MALNYEQTTSTSPYQSDIITILIGPSQATFRVHKDFVCAASGFFRGCFNANMHETSSKTVSLPDDEPEAFRKVLDYTYGSMLLKKPPADAWSDAWNLVVEVPAQISKEWEVILNLIGPYALADKLCMEEIQNKTMNTIIQSSKSCLVHCAVLEQVCDNPPISDSKLK